MEPRRQKHDAEERKDDASPSKNGHEPRPLWAFDREQADRGLPFQLGDLKHFDGLWNPIRLHDWNRFTSKTEDRSNMRVHLAGHTNAPRLRHGMDARSNVDRIAENIAVLLDDVPHVDANPKSNRRVLFAQRNVESDLLLQFDRVGHGLDRTVELQQEAIAQTLDELAVSNASLLSNDRLDPMPQIECQLFVAVGAVRIPDDIGEYDRCKSALDFDGRSCFDADQYSTSRTWQ